MPIRVYRCYNGHETEEALPFGPYEQYIPCPRCDRKAKSIPAPFATKFPSDREAEIRAKGQIPYEPGIEADANRARRYREEALNANIERVCADVVRQNPDIRPD